MKGNRKANMKMNIKTVIKTLVIAWAILSTINAVAYQAWNRTYNDNNQVLTEDGPRTDVNDITTFTYSGSNLESVTNALGHTLYFQNYDIYGNPQETVDANGVKTEITYDRNNRIETLRIKDPAGVKADSVTRYKTNNFGLLEEVESPSGIVTYFTYDDAKRLTTITNSIGESIQYTLDAAGNVTAEHRKTAQGAVRYTVTQHYDELSRLIGIDGAMGQTSSQTYDARGNNTGNTDGRQHSTANTYDEFNRLTSITDALQGVTQLAYDKGHRLDTITDAEGLITDYTFDAYGNLKKLISPDTDTTLYEYDDAGNLTKVTNSLNVVVEYQYDALNRLTHVIYPASPNENITYVYDETTNGNVGLGRLTKIHDASGTTSLRYDYLGHLIERSYTIENQSYSLRYHYDATARLNHIIYPSGRILTYHYDSQDRVNKIESQDYAGAAAQTLVSNIHYEPFGPIKSYDYGNGLSQIITYDQSYRIEKIETQANTNVIEMEYGYDHNNNITSLNNVLNNSENQSFVYDELNRLESANGLYGSLIYGYDKIGNRKSKQHTHNSSVISEVYHYVVNSHRLDKIEVNKEGSLSTQQFAYDAAGNQTRHQHNDPQASWNAVTTYNHANRPSTTTVNGSTLNFVHNAFGLRTVKSVSHNATNKTEHFHYDEAGQLIAVSDEHGQFQNEYIYLGTTPIATTIKEPSQPTALYYTHADHLNTVRTITDANQQKMWTMSTTPFGVGEPTTDVDGDGIHLSFGLRFPGQYWDEETRSSYNWHRNYDPATGRYVQSDRLGLFDGPNTYAYVHGNPLSYTDPTGQNALMLNGARMLVVPVPGARVVGGLLIAGGGLYALSQLYNQSSSGSGSGSGAGAGNSGGAGDFCLRNPNHPFCQQSGGQGTPPQFCPTRAAPSHNVNNALRNFQNQHYQFGQHPLILNRSGMNHILTRHHPNYWNGSWKSQQSFFNPGMSPSQIQGAMRNILMQNRGTIAQRGTSGIYQVRGSHNGVNYVLGINRGKVGQFYPVY